METFKKAVTSNQEGIHSSLEEVVKKHLLSTYQRPIAAHTQSVFDSLVESLQATSKPLIFDTGCGTGESSIALSKQHPDSIVIGIDRSLTRIEKGKKLIEDRVILIRAELSDFWRLALKNGITPTHQYFLYPNPYPKKQHLKRRWHAHPVFPDILKLGGELIMRSDWRIYLEEFSAALDISEQYRSSIKTLNTKDAISPFEKKYIAQKRELYELKAFRIDPKVT